MNTRRKGNELRRSDWRRIAGEQRRRALTRRGTVEIGIERQWNREALNSSEPELQRFAVVEQRIEMHNLTIVAAERH